MTWDFSSVQHLMPKSLSILFAVLFTLSASGVSAQETPTPRDGLFSVAGCAELLSNGGFEVEGVGWQSAIPGLPTEYAERYVTDLVYSGSRSLRLGFLEATNAELRNGIQQQVTLPDDARTIVLGFRHRPVQEANPGTDLQYLDIIDPLTDVRITRLWAQQANQGNWLFLQYDLTSLRGRTIEVEFGVSNDGTGGRTALFLDEVSLLACEGGSANTATPTPTSDGTTTATATATSTPGVIVIAPTKVSPLPSPTITATPLNSPTPVPEGCLFTTLLTNGGFELPLDDPLGWEIGDDPIEPELSSTSNEGLRSLLMGNPDNSGYANIESYSSVRQLIALPATAVTAELSWYQRPFAQDGNNTTPTRHQDRQELILLYPDLSTKRILQRRLINTGGWQRESVDLTNFLGQSFFVYFNVYNNGSGGRTWMYLDDVRLQVCFTTPTSTPTPLPTATPTLEPVSDSNQNTSGQNTTVIIPDVRGADVETAARVVGQSSAEQNEVARAADEQVALANESPQPSIVGRLGNLLAGNLAVAFWIVFGIFVVVNFFRWFQRSRGRS